MPSIISEEEDKYVHSACASVGYLGGTRLRPTTGELSEDGLHYTADTNGNIFNTTNINEDEAYVWYWACGPEIGKTFFDYPSYSTMTNKSSSYDKQAQKYYFNWRAKKSSEEPNGTGNTKEYVLTTLNNVGDGYKGTKYSWNDVSYRNNTNYQYAAKGYFVEYGNKRVGDNSNNDDDTFLIEVGLLSKKEPQEIDATDVELEYGTVFDFSELGAAAVKKSDMTTKTGIKLEYSLIGDEHDSSLDPVQLNETTGKAECKSLGEITLKISTVKDTTNTYSKAPDKYITIKVVPKYVEFDWEVNPLTYNSLGQQPVPVAVDGAILDADKNDVSIVYDSTEKISVDLVSGAAKNVGKYTGIVKLTGDKSDRYTLIDATHTKGNKKEFTINPAEVTVTWNKNSFEYNGEEQMPTAKYSTSGVFSADSSGFGAIPSVIADPNDSASALNKNGESVDVGKYIASVKFNNSNYIPSVPTYAFTITPVTVGLSWNPTEFTYDGKEHIPTATLSKVITADSAYISAETTGKKTNVGNNYTATATKLIDSRTNKESVNYVLPETKTTTFKIVGKSITDPDPNDPDNPDKNTPASGMTVTLILPASLIRVRPLILQREQLRFPEVLW